MKNISVFDCLELFQKHSIVRPNETETLPDQFKKIKFETDLGWSFDSFIEAGKFIISERSTARPGTTKYLTDANATVGDIIHIRKIDDFHFSLSLEKNHG